MLCSPIMPYSVSLFVAWEFPQPSKGLAGLSPISPFPTKSRQSVGAVLAPCILPYWVVRMPVLLVPVPSGLPPPKHRLCVTTVLPPRILRTSGARLVWKCHRSAQSTCPASSRAIVVPGTMQSVHFCHHCPMPYGQEKSFPPGDLVRLRALG